MYRGIKNQTTYLAIFCRKIASSRKITTLNTFSSCARTPIRNHDSTYLTNELKHMPCPARGWLLIKKRKCSCFVSACIEAPPGDVVANFFNCIVFYVVHPTSTSTVPCMIADNNVLIKITRQANHTQKTIASILHAQRGALATTSSLS